MQIMIIEAIIVIFLIIVTLAVIFDPDLFACTILFCVFSFCAVLTYLFFGSPDVAFTEAVIGTMSTIFFAVALKKVDRYCRTIEMKKEDATESVSKRKFRRLTRTGSLTIMQKIMTFALLAFICAAFCFGTHFLPKIGDANSAPNTHVADYYIEDSKEDTEANNIVSGTLADYRGYDTMFETSVMFVSGLVVTLILYTGKKKGQTAKKGGHTEAVTAPPEPEKAGEEVIAP